MERFISEMRATIAQYGTARTVIFFLTAPVRIPLILCGFALLWLGQHLIEDYPGALISGRIFHEKD